MGRCGTDEACPDCPITAGISQGEYGEFNYQYSEAEMLGAAAERLHIAGYQDITDEGAAAVVAAHAVDNLEGAPQRLQSALQRLGSSACVLLVG